MNDHMRRLREELIKKMNQKNCSIKDFSIACDVSYHSMRNIVNGISNDMKLSTFLKLCENANISYAEIFNINNSDVLDFALKSAVFSCGKSRYRLRKEC